MIPWLNQALGIPQERAQHTTPSTFEELEQMDTAQLEQLVAAGRKRRLEAVPAPGPVAESGNSPTGKEGPEGHPPKLARPRGSRVREGAAMSRMGTRAVVATALAEKAEQVHQAVRLLCDSAAAGDLKSAQALIPWINQALGMPTEWVQHRTPGFLEELEQMDTAELEALVAEGRRKRLKAVASPPSVVSTRNELTS